MKRYFQFLGLAVVLFCAAAFVRNPPYWNRMDDATNLQWSQGDWADKGVVRVVIDSVRSDLKGWGLFRPLYYAYIYFMYGAFPNQPVHAYLLLAVVMFAFFAGWAVLFDRMVAPGEDGRWAYLFLALCFAFSPHLQLLFYISIQEKFIVAAGLFGFIALHRYFIRLHNSPRDRFQTGIFLAGFISLVLGLSVGWLAKSTTLYLLGPIFFWLLTDTIQTGRKENIAMMVSVGFAGILAFLFSWTHRGYYSAGYSPLNFSNYLPQLGKKTVAYLIFVLAVAAASIAIGKKQRGSWRLALSPRQLIWPIGFVCFLLIMLPWPGGTSGYYLTGGSIFMVGTMTLSINLLLTEFPARAIKTATTVGLFLLVINRAFPCYRMFQTRSAERDIVQWIDRQITNNPGNPPFIGMPVHCQEASESLAYFSGHPNSIQRLPMGEPSIVPVGKMSYLITVGECPAENIQGFDLEHPVFSKGDWKIFTSTSPAAQYSS